MKHFMDLWIKHASFKHYRGGVFAAKGEGAGCADFVTEFMSLAMPKQLPLQSWVVDVRIPMRLVTVNTSLSEVLRTTEWAKEDEDFVPFSIPNPESLYDWLKPRVDLQGVLRLNSLDQLSDAPHKSAVQIPKTSFKGTGLTLSSDVVQRTWARILIP
jgi:hypothetical protein